MRWASARGAGSCTVAWLNVEDFDVDAAQRGVTDNEWLRARSFTREQDRRRSLGSAWLARRMAAAVLDVDPLQVPIHRRCRTCGRPHGRPVVDARGRQGEVVELSASHSGGLVGVAVTTSGAAVGLDVEDLTARGPGAWGAVWRAMRVEPPRPPAQTGDRAAAVEWTRTEAVLKATGHGLAAGVRSVETRSTPEGPVVVRWPWGPPRGRVSLFDLAPAPRYVAALAVIHDGRRDLEVLPATARGGGVPL